MMKKFIWIIVGILIGVLTGFLRSFNSFSLFSFSDIAGKYGFWILTVSLIAFFSKNKRSAFVNSFLYMFSMCVSYYTYLYLSSSFLYLKEFILWGIFSFIASIYAIYLNKNEGKFISLIPIFLLSLEFSYVFVLLIKYHTNLFQFLVDFIGIIILLILYMKNKDSEFKKKIIICLLLAILISLIFFL